MSFRLLLISAAAIFTMSGCGAAEESGPSTSENQEVYISAASSLQDVLEETAAEFEEKHPHIDIVFNFGSSGSLKQQISQGAPVDLFISASPFIFQELVSENKMADDYYQNWLSNQLVLIEPVNTKDSISEIRDLRETKISKIALGTPDSVPAGAYAKETLENSGLWYSLEDKLIPSKNVRQALTYVESENANAGFVYLTDALTSEKVRVVEEIDQSLHNPIVYPAGIVKGSEQTRSVVDVYEFLLSEEHAEDIESYGFRYAEEEK
ncbi:molybdate ABC transporter substrate-binding protein [Alteribacillus sp. HJP-4]|uniref:molybdate ABC transporter substrate-binding protein n=1 Tax=Alteribacillus sp. HJP-4 TaxID=2775394 RepID=UPI0035CD1FFD